MKLTDKEKANVLENLYIGIDSSPFNGVIAVSILYVKNGTGYQVYGKHYESGKEIPPITGKGIIDVLEEDEFKLLEEIIRGGKDERL